MGEVGPQRCVIQPQMRMMVPSPPPGSVLPLVSNTAAARSAGSHTNTDSRNAVNGTAGICDHRVSRPGPPAAPGRTADTQRCARTGRRTTPRRAPRTPPHPLRPHPRRARSTPGSCDPAPQPLTTRRLPPAQRQTQATVAGAARRALTVTVARRHSEVMSVTV